MSIVNNERYNPAPILHCVRGRNASINRSQRVLGYKRDAEARRRRFGHEGSLRVGFLLGRQKVERFMVYSNKLMGSFLVKASIMGSVACYYAGNSADNSISLAHSLQYWAAPLAQ